MRGYKKDDSYAIEKQFYEQVGGESVFVTIDPFDSTADRVKLHWDMAKGVRYLRLLRDLRAEEFNLR